MIRANSRIANRATNVTLPLVISLIKIETVMPIQIHRTSVKHMLPVNDTIFVIVKDQ